MPHFIQPLVNVLHIFCIIYDRVIKFSLGMEEVAVPQNPVGRVQLSLHHSVKVQVYELLLEVLPVGMAPEWEQRTPA